MASDGPLRWASCGAAGVATNKVRSQQHTVGIATRSTDHDRRRARRCGPSRCQWRSVSARDGSLACHFSARRARSPDGLATSASFGRPTAIEPFNLRQSTPKMCIAIPIRSTNKKTTKRKKRDANQLSRAECDGASARARLKKAALFFQRTASKATDACLRERGLASRSVQLGAIDGRQVATDAQQSVRKKQTAPSNDTDL